MDRFRRARDGGTAGDRAVLEGFHPVKHALRFGADLLEVLTPDPDEPLELARQLAPDVYDRLADLLTPVSPDVYDRLCPRPPSSGVVALARRASPSVREVLDDPEPAPLVHLDTPTHLGNLGAVVRVAAASGAAGVLATGPHDPWHPRALRGSTGLHYALPVAAVPELPETDRPVAAVDPEGEPLPGTGGLPPRAVLAFGSERRGLAGDLLARAEHRIRIPMHPGVSSLNLATSAAVVLYAWRLGSGPPQSYTLSGK